MHLLTVPQYEISQNMWSCPQLSHHNTTN